MSSPGNVAVLALLSSPAHRLLDRRVCALSYRGPRTGVRHTFPVQYVPDGDDAVLVAAGRPERKNWWRVMRSPRPVQVLVRGRWRGGMAQIVPAAQDRAAREAYRRAFPRVGPDAPVIRIRLDAVRKAAADVVRA